MNGPNFPYNKIRKSGKPRLLYGMIAAVTLFIIAILVFMSLIPKNLPLGPPREPPALETHRPIVEDVVKESVEAVEEIEAMAEEIEPAFDAEAMEVIQGINRDIAENQVDDTEAESLDPGSEESYGNTREELIDQVEREKQEKLKAFEIALNDFDLGSRELKFKWQRLVYACNTGWYDEKDRENLERVWYRVWEINMDEYEDRECRGLLREIRNKADKIRDGVSAAIGQARRDGLLPGDIRNLRLQYRFTWNGFN